MDLSADPCQDFYQFACGHWSQNHPLPADQATQNTFAIMKEKMLVNLRDLLSQAIDTNDTKASSSAKILFKSCMDQKLIEVRGSYPLIQLLNDDFGGWPVIKNDWSANDTMEWFEIIAKLRTMNNNILIEEWVGADAMNSNINLIHLDQPQLGLPTRDYFLSNDSDILKGYHSYMVDVAKLLSQNSSTTSLSLETEKKIEEDMREVLDFEISLANITISPERRRTMNVTHSKLSISGLNVALHEVNWTRYFEIIFEPVAQLNETQSVMIFTLEYFDGLFELINGTSKR